MSQVGACKRVQLTQGNKGFALFSNPQEAQSAIATLNNSLLGGKKITVDSYSKKPGSKVGFSQGNKRFMGKFKIWGQPKVMQKTKVKFEIHHPTGTVWLGNLPSGVTFQEVQAHMSKAGTCKRVQLTKGEKGFALFSSPQEAQNAVATLNGSKLKGTKITVDAYAKKLGSSFSGGGKSKGKGKGMHPKVKTPETTAWVGNLAEGTGYKEVQELLSQAGSCKRVEILKNGCAFAYMGSADEVTAAVALSGTDLNGQAIVVDFYEKKPKAA